MAVCTRGLGPEGTALCTHRLVPRTRLASGFLTSIPCFHTGRLRPPAHRPAQGQRPPGGRLFPHSTGQLTVGCRGWSTLGLGTLLLLAEANPPEKGTSISSYLGLGAPAKKRI